MRVVCYIEQMNDEEKCSFIKELKNGNHQAHRKLYKLYAMEIFKYIRAYFLFDSFAAEDILQEVFLTAYLKISSLKDINKVRAWLYRVASSKCLNYIKKKKTERKYMEEVGKNINIFNNKSVEDRVIEKDVFHIVDNEIHRLPDFLQKVFILKEYQKLTYEEIVLITDSTISKVKRAMKKAMSKLLKYLEEKEIKKDLF